LDPPEIDDTPERDNNVQTEDDGDMATFPPKTVTTTPSSNGFAPTFSNQNALNKLVVKPSGNSIKMKCPARGDPEPTIEWTKDGKPIDREMGQVQKSKWGISLEDLIPSDSGSYTCKICNIYGCIDFTSKLEVTGECQNFFKTISRLTKLRCRTFATTQIDFHLRRSSAKDIRRTSPC
jgi:fibroblast growth factor receptor 2